MSASRASSRFRLPVGGGETLGREGLGRTLASVLAGTIAVLLLLWLAWNAGGYFPASFLTTGTVAFAALAVVLIVRPPHYVLSTPALIGLASLIGLVLWTALSGRWSPSPGLALDLVQRDLSYMGLFGLGLIAAGSGRFARQLVLAVLVVVALVIGAGVFARLFPLIVGGDVEISFGGYRLEYPLSYWNAYGGLAAFGVVLALGLGADAHWKSRWRALTAAAAVVMALGLYLSFSRGAWVAVMAGWLMLLALGPRRWWLALTSLPTLLAAGLGILLVQSHPELVDVPAGVARQADAGVAFAPVLAILMAAAAAAQVAMPSLTLQDHSQASLRRLAVPLAIPVAAAAVVGVIVIVALGGLNSVDRFANRQWQDFMRATTPVAPEAATPTALGQPPLFAGRGNARLTNVKGTRSEVYRVALAEFAANPVIGGGAGSFEYYWYRGRRVGEDLRNAHSLYLETLAELGIVGGLLLLGFVGSVVAAGLRARARPRVLRTTQATAVAAAVGVWLVHTAYDWDWQVSAFTASALVLAAALYPEGRRVRRRRRSPAAASPAEPAALRRVG